MAAVTENLAFGVTACTTFEPPFSLAKRFSTLDHLTNGRMAWVRYQIIDKVDHGHLTG